MNTPQLADITLPDDLTTLSDADLSALLGQIAAAAEPFAGLGPDEHTDDTIAAVTRLSELAAPVTAEQQARADRAAATATATETAAGLAALAPAAPEQATTEPVPETPTEPAEPEPVVAARPPGVADIPRSPQAPPVPDRPAPTVSMVAAADVPGFATGQGLNSWADAAKALEGRLKAYGHRGEEIGRRVPGTIDVQEVNGAPADGRDMQVARVHQMRNYTRHGGVKFVTDAPAQLRLNSNDGIQNLRTLEIARKEARCAGGGLVQRMLTDVKNGRSLVAAAGWGGPNETIWDLCEQETLDGLLTLPEVTADRGGFQIPTDGGPDFSSIFTGIGNAGDTHLTEAEVIADTPKVAVEIPTPGFTNVRLGVDYVAITGSLLQRRGYPELVARYGRGALVALEHKINMQVIADIMAGSTNGGTIPAAAGGDDAASAALSGVEAVIVDAQYRLRSGMDEPFELLMPFYGLAQIRAAMARRRGTATMNVSNAEIADWFATRNAVPRPVYGLGDAYSGTVGGPGGATPLTALPTTMQVAIYPAGTWVKAKADVVDLDTIYDSTLLTANQYTAIFAETGWAVMKMCPLSRRYTIPVDPAGCLCEPATP